jgi:hypothetical protein
MKLGKYLLDECRIGGVYPINRNRQIHMLRSINNMLAAIYIIKCYEKGEEAA